MSSFSVDSTPTVFALAAQSPAPSHRAASGRLSLWERRSRRAFFSSRVAAIRPSMRALSKLALVMVANRFWVMVRFTAGDTSCPSRPRATATAAIPLVTYTKRSCMAATSGVFPHTPTRVQPVHPAVS